MKPLLRVLSALFFVPVIGFPAHFLWTFGSAPWQEKPLQWMPGGLVPVYMLPQRRVLDGAWHHRRAFPRPETLSNSLTPA